MNASLLESMDDAADALRRFIIFRREICLRRRTNPPQFSFFFGDRFIICFQRWFFGSYAGRFWLELMATFFTGLIEIFADYPFARLQFIFFSHLSMILTCFVLWFYISTYELPIYEEWDSDEDS